MLDCRGTGGVWYGNREADELRGPSRHGVGGGGRGYDLAVELSMNMRGCHAVGVLWDCGRGRGRRDVEAC